MTPTKVYTSVAQTVGLKHQQVKHDANAMMAHAAKQLKDHGSFKFAGPFIMALKKKPSRKRRIIHGPGIPTVITEAKPASQTLRVRPTKKFREMIAAA